MLRGERATGQRLPIFQIKLKNILYHSTKRSKIQFALLANRCPVAHPTAILLPTHLLDILPAQVRLLPLEPNATDCGTLWPRIGR